MDRRDVYRAIDVERAYQDGKWGTLAQNPHTVQEWVKIALEEMCEANAARTDSDRLDELRQVAAVCVAAVCVAALEQHGC